MMLHMKFLFMFMHVISALAAREPSCPACSRYDFEEKLLERVLRNELVIETMLKEIRETNSNVESALKMMHDDRNTLKSTLDALEKSKEEMHTSLKETLVDVTQNASITISEMHTSLKKTLVDVTQNASMTISQIKKENAILKDQLSIPTVYFHVHSSTVGSLTSGQDMIYKTIRVNEGHGYDQNTGRFTASIPGLYAFTVQYCTSTSYYAELAIVRDGTQLQRSYFHSTTYYQCVSMQAFVKLTISMQVWVKSMQTSNIHANLDMNSFSGVLLHL